MEAALDRGPEQDVVYVPRAFATGEVLEPADLLEAPLKTTPRPSMVQSRRRSNGRERTPPGGSSSST